MRTRAHPITLRSSSVGLLLAAAALLLPAPVAAQYFGRNKVQYEDFDFRILNLPHWDLYFYPGEEESISDVSRMAERWYERFARTFQHEFEKTKPLIIYADQPDWQQTNTLQGFISEGTGGVTESLKNRVIMPQTGSYHDTDHVLGHEMVHAFQYNIAQSRRGGGQQGLNTMPLWVVEGMAEYMSIGRDSPLTGMWLRDALRMNDFPTIKDLTKGGKYFPYRFGQGLMAYIGGTYGDDAVVQLFRRAVRIGFEPAIEQVLGVDHDSLSAQWKRAVDKEYRPLLVDRTAPDSTGTLLISPATGGGQMNIGPALSPDGKYLAYLSEQDLFSVDLFMADAHTGKKIRKLQSATSNPHSDAIRYVESSGTWSPNGTLFAFSVYVDGDNAIEIVNTEDGSEWKMLKPLADGMINNPSWSPDGKSIVFSGTVGGISDLYLVNVEDGSNRQLTNDKYGDFQPDWSPDGRTIVFTSDRGPETSFEKLAFSDWRLSFMNVNSGEIETPELLGNVRHSNAQYAPDGSLYFLSDGDGFSDIYRYRPQSGRGDGPDHPAVERITRIATGVTGHTPLAPALSVSRTTGEMAFSVFNHFEFHIMTMGANPTGTPQVAFTVEEQLAREVPPANPDRFSRVSEYVHDDATGLEPPGTYNPASAKAYQPALALDYVGQPSLGVGTDRFGNYVGGGAAAYFSDMLGNQVLGAAVQAQGTVKDIGGSVFYQDVGHRWNWGAGVSHVPYVLSYVGQGVDDGGQYLGQILDRLYVSSATGLLSYPFSQTRRFEAQGGFTRYASNRQIQKYYYDEFGRIYDRQDEDLSASFDPLDLIDGSLAIVHDNAFFGFTSPVRGGRSRYEVAATSGTLNFLTLTADWRRYFGISRNLTFATRGLSFGRYGNLSQHSDVLQPTFLGYEWYMRGYSYESFTPEECIASQSRQTLGDSCPVRNRLFGQKLVVGSAEFRVPLFGVREYGLIPFPFLPTELVAFVDGGVSWDNTLNDINGVSAIDTPVDWTLSRSGSLHVPVFSTGVGARFNVLGFMILEAYYAYPWERPVKGAHWGFQLAPGW